MSSASTFEDIAAITSASVMPTYKRLDVCFARGEGMYLFDTAGKSYLDFVAGIAVTALGHSHPAVTEAIAEQAGKLVHTSNLYHTEPMAKLAEALKELTGWSDAKVFFANSGAEANECALKLVRRWSHDKYGSQRFETTAAHGSFHGRTLETLAATGQPKKWEGFAPLPTGFIHVAYDDAEALGSAVNERTCAVLLEPVQGEGGVVAPKDDYLPLVRKICDEADLAFIADEVQTGFGRTGHWFGFQASSAVPDVMTLAKALGNGLPIGACIARGVFADAFKPGDHATTIGGGPVVCAAALAVIDTMKSLDLPSRAAQIGAYLEQRLRGLATTHEMVKGCRGKGLLLALELHSAVARQVVLKSLDQGLLVNDVTADAVRLSPPLIAEKSHCDQA
ncbi:MAG: aspartate aminotransferase family protein, partial [Actinomycetota bacterium]